MPNQRMPVRRQADAGTRPVEQPCPQSGLQFADPLRHARLREPEFTGGCMEAAKPHNASEGSDLRERQVHRLSLPSLPKTFDFRVVRHPAMKGASNRETT